jgi:hypothetical protein
VDGYSYQSVTIGAETTLTWTIPTAMQATLAANPTLATSMTFQIGGGYSAGNETMYLDNLRIIDTVPEPSTIALIGLGAAGLLAIRRRKA